MIKFTSCPTRIKAQLDLSQDFAKLEARTAALLSRLSSKPRKTSSKQARIVLVKPYMWKVQDSINVQMTSGNFEEFKRLYLHEVINE